MKPFLASLRFVLALPIAIPMLAVAAVHKDAREPLTLWALWLIYGDDRILK